MLADIGQSKFVMSGDGMASDCTIAELSMGKEKMGGSLWPSLSSLN